MAISNSCNSIQTFCALGKQTVSDWDELKFTYSPPPAKDTQKITAEIWNEIIQAITKIYNFGIRGTRNPAYPLGITNFKAVTNNAVGNETANSAVLDTTSEEYKKKLQDINNYILLEDYNEILSTINLSNISQIPITEEQFNLVKNTINNLKLNNTRCNNCNTACNVTCQASSQCYTPPCYTDCYSKCEGTACGGATFCINFM